MVTGQRVLVVGGLEETGEVLKAVLEPRGLQVRRINTSAHLGQCRSERPSVIVLHEESPALGSEWGDVPRILIGSATIAESAAPEAAPGSPTYIQKPFHYGELITAIEQLLGTAL